MDDGAIRNGVQLNVAQAGFRVCRTSFNSQNKSVGTDRLRKQHSHDALMGPQIEDDGAWFQFRLLQKRDLRWQCPIVGIPSLSERIDQFNAEIVISEALRNELPTVAVIAVTRAIAVDC